MREYQETSREAFDKVRPHLRGMKQTVYEVFLSSGPLTADEVADILNKHVLSVRPAVTMLKKAGLIKDSTLRRPTSVLGNNAIVWEVTSG